MTGRTLTLGALVALTQAIAIVTNNCPHDVYVWSVPQSGGSNATGLPIKSGTGYEESWRYGTNTNPGVAIKISPQADGIYKDGDELEFAYSVAGANKSKVWVNLSPVHGSNTFGNIIFRTCQGSFTTPEVSTVQCDVSNNIELLLCGANPGFTPTARVIPSSSIMTGGSKATDNYSPPPKPTYTSKNSHAYPVESVGYSSLLKPITKHTPPMHTSEEPHLSGPPEVTSEYSRPTYTSHVAYASPTTNKGYSKAPKVADSYGPPPCHEEEYYKAPVSTHHSASVHHQSSSTPSKAYNATTSVSKVYNATTSVSKAHKATTSTPRVHNTSATVSKTYHVSSKTSVAKSRPVASAYALPSTKPHKDTYDEIEEEEEDEEDEEMSYALPTDEYEYPALQPTKAQPHHPHSPPSKPTTTKAYPPPQDSSKHPSSSTNPKITASSTSTRTRTITSTSNSTATHTSTSTRTRTTTITTTPQPLPSRIRRTALPSHPSSRQAAAPKACFTWFHEPALPNMTREQAYALLNAYLTVKGRAFADVLTTNATECAPRAPRVYAGRYSACVVPLCGAVGDSCVHLGDDLETAAKVALGKDVAFTTVREVCA